MRDGFFNRNYCKFNRVFIACTLVWLQGCGEQGRDSAGEQLIPEPQPGQDTTVPNRGPEILSTPVTASNLNDIYFYQGVAADPDGDELIWSLDAAPAGMMIESSTGFIAGQGLPAGEHVVTLRVADGQGGSDTQNFTLSIFDGPVIFTSPAKTTFTDTPYRYQAGAVDPHDLELIYTLVEGPGGMTVGPGSGLLEWTTGPAGVFNVEILVTNTVGRTAGQKYDLTVLPVDGVTIVSGPVTEAYVSQAYNYQMTVISSGGNTGIYSLITNPPGMTIDAGTGLVSWVPTVAGMYTVEAQVLNDKGHSDSQNYMVVVRTLEEMDQIFKGMMDELFQDLIQGNRTDALQHLTGEAKGRLGPAFDALLPYMDEVAANYTEVVRISVTPEMAEYVVRRTGDAGTRVFMVNFMRDFDGNWKLNDM